MFHLFLTSSLEKILPKSSFDAEKTNRFFALEGEIISFQAAFSADGEGGDIYSFRIEHDEGVKPEIFFVKNVAVDYATHARAYFDDNYISHEPGLFPDILEPCERDWVYANNIYHSLWISAETDRGVHEIKISFYDKEGNAVASERAVIETAAAALPEQKLVYTQWFHTDCIADYYNCPVFSEELWQMTEKYLRTARKYGINMILTPVFTPPLDTFVGEERPTVQLVKITKTSGSYDFDFTLLRRWIDLCRRVGFENFEMPHLFTQWGAVATPKIVASVDGEEKNIFGWHVPADDKSYDEFLSCFLPSLIGELKSLGVFENTYFHISDEPANEHRENYALVKNIAAKYLSGCRVIDAVSDRDMFSGKTIDVPVTATDCIKNFPESEIYGGWCYYCNAQCVGVSNRFVAMPSARNRSLGVQLYKYKMRGFLHWGYNFYYSRFSRLKLNPFYENDAYGAFPSGDAVSVYPGKQGPMPAIGLVVFNEALQDMRALSLLEKYIGYENTVRFAEDILGGEITFERCFPADALLRLREKLCAVIGEAGA